MYAGNVEVIPVVAVYSVLWSNSVLSFEFSDFSLSLREPRPGPREVSRESRANASRQLHIPLGLESGNEGRCPEPGATQLVVSGCFSGITWLMSCVYIVNETHAGGG